MTRHRLPWLALAGLAALVALAAPAAAEWVEGKPDCPPDMMCTTALPPTEDAGAPGEPRPGPPAVDEPKAEEPTRGPAGDCVDWCPRSDVPAGDGPGAPPGRPADCDGDACAHDRPAPPPDVDTATCMDGSAPPEVCESDMQYLGGSGPPPGAGAGDGDGVVLPAGAGARDVPTPGLLLLLGALGLGALAAVAGRVRPR